MDNIKENQLTGGYILSNLDNILKGNTDYKGLFYHNSKVFDVLDDDFLCLMEEQASKFSTAMARKNNKDMALAVNYLKKIVDHKSQLYTFDVGREANANQDLMEQYIKILNIDSVLNKGNSYYNATFSTLLEFYQDRTNQLKLRALPNKNFYVYSDDIVEPNNPTAYIKIIRTEERLVKGVKKEVELLHIWTDTEVMVVYSNKEVVSYTANPYGIAPFVYVTAQPHRLMPAVARDLLHNLVQINNIFTAGNVNNFWLANPLRWIKNVNKDELKIDINPNSFILLNAPDGSTTTPDIGEVSTSLDLNAAFEYAKNLLNEILYVNDIQAKDAVQGTPQSGVSIQLKDSDMVESRKLQIEQWRPAEEAVWSKLGIIHNAIIDKKLGGAKTPVGKFNDNFEVIVDFELPDTNNQVQNPNEQKVNGSTQADGGTDPNAPKDNTATNQGE